MWIFLNNAFLSIVEEGAEAQFLLVRARRQGDLERIFPEAVVEETPRRDYRFRARIDRETVAQALADTVRGIHYPNFKNSVDESHRHHAYAEVWSVMYRFQSGARH